MKGYVVGFMFSMVEFYSGTYPMVALIRKNRPEWQKGRLNGIGGKIEPGELPDDAMVREFKEETGLEFKGWRQFMRQYGAEEVLYFYVALVERPVLDQLKTTTDETIVIEEVDEACESSEEQKDRTVPNLRWELHAAWLAARSNLFLDINVGERP